MLAFEPDQGPFSISLLQLSQLKAKIAVNSKCYLNIYISSNNGRCILYHEYMIIPIQEGLLQ